jgi:hypothetical protein
MIVYKLYGVSKFILSIDSDNKIVLDINNYIKINSRDEKLNKLLT